MSSESHWKNCSLSNEQIALQEHRRQRKAEAASEVIKAGLKPTRSIQLSQRRWLTANRHEGEVYEQQIKVMTWNMLAQCLVRKISIECVYAHAHSPVEGMLYYQITSSGADIICLQEVDCLEKLIPVLEDAQYSHTFSAGPHKKHGCFIAYKTFLFKKLGDRTVFYDECNMRTKGDEINRRGSTFRTKNIGLVVALQRIGSDERVVVATTHLFWHPRYTYERTRQAGILVREVAAFRDQMQCSKWPSIVAGDFNFAPNDAAYSLLVGDAMLPQQDEELSASRVVHVSIDPTVASTALPEDEEEGDPDRVKKNVRPPRVEDGLLDTQEMISFYESIPRLRSVYDQWPSSDARVTFGSRVDIPVSRRGRFEPIYTSYTHYWKTVLDYIFVIEPPGRSLKVVGLLEPLQAEQLEPGLPQQGVCGSDHISLLAAIAWGP